MASQVEKEEQEAIKAAFGAVNRRRLIDLYFSQQPAEEITPASAWRHVYRLLLWADQTSGLAHCYESDKSQPGGNWYARSLAFHDWLSKTLGVEPHELGTAVDWLFRKAAADLAQEVTRNAERLANRASKQREPYAGRGFPEPGEDPELVLAVREEIGTYLAADPAVDRWRALAQRVRKQLALENKRKNLVGEGFEDVLGQVVTRMCRLPPEGVAVRKDLYELPGFNRARAGAKENKVDLAVLRPSMRTIVTAKWSLRADREKTFPSELDEYTRAESEQKRFEYVFVTNEFDPARLMRACEQLVHNAPMFSHVVHISTDAIRATYGAKPKGSMGKVVGFIDTGRLISLEQWLNDLSV